MWFQGLNLVKFDERTVETAFADVCFALPSSQPPFTPYCCLLITLIASGTLLLVRARRFLPEVKDKVRARVFTRRDTHTEMCHGWQVGIMDTLQGLFPGGAES